jgi:hypothetical protein
MRYYLALEQQQTSELAEVAFSTATFISARLRGLVTNSFLVMGHILILLAVTLAFARSTNISHLGHSWQAVS